MEVCSTREGRQNQNDLPWGEKASILCPSLAMVVRELSLPYPMENDYKEEDFIVGYPNLTEPLFPS